MRKSLNGMKADDTTNILNMFAHTRNNCEFVQTVKNNDFYNNTCIYKIICYNLKAVVLVVKTLK